MRFTGLIRWQETGSLKRTRRCKGSQAQAITGLLNKWVDHKPTHWDMRRWSFAEVGLASEEA